MVSFDQIDNLQESSQLIVSAAILRHLLDASNGNLVATQCVPKGVFIVVSEWTAYSDVHHIFQRVAASPWCSP